MSGLFDMLAARVSECPSVGEVRAATVAAEAEDMALGPVATVLIVPAAERWTPVREAGMRVGASGQFGFSCVVALTFPGGFAEWEAVRQEIRAALLGWEPQWPEAAGPVQASGGRLLAYSAEAGGRWIHAFDFNLPVQATYEHQP